MVVRIYLKTSKSTNSTNVKNNNTRSKIMENNNIAQPENKKSISDGVKLIIGIFVVIAGLVGLKFLMSALGMF